MNIQPVKTKVFQEGQDLIKFITHHIDSLSNGSIVVITSKIVALAEHRTIDLVDNNTKEEVIKAESQIAVPTKYVWLTLKDNMVMASAGVDESNAKGKLILLPKDSFHSAQKLREQLMVHYKLKRLGILVTDSRVLPLRAGVVGVALGYAGFKGLRDYRGKPDIFGRKLVMSQTNIADSLASAAVLIMGEGNERQPLAVVSHAPVTFTARINRHELEISLDDDLYGPLFDNLKEGGYDENTLKT